MHKTKIFLLSLLLNIMIISCSKVNHVGSTTVSFMRSDRISENAEIIVTGHSTGSDLASFFTLDIPSGQNSLSLELPNGSWTFSAIGWPQSNMNGDLHCSQAVPSQSLTGITTSIPIFLDQSSCWEEPFNVPEMQNSDTTPASILPLKIVTCAGLEDEDSVKSNANNNRTSAKALDYPALSNYCANNVGTLKSFKVIMPLIPLSTNQDFFNAVDNWYQESSNVLSDIGQDFETQCIDFPDADKTLQNYANTSIQLPLGVSGSVNDLMFHPFIKGFTDLNCQGPYKVFDLINNKASSGGKVISDTEVDQMQVVYLLDQPIVHKFISGLQPQNSTELCSTNPVILKFNTTIDPSSVTVTEAAGSTLAGLSWSESDTKLTISPNYKWKNYETYSNATNTISLSGNTTESETFSFDLTYSTCSTYYCPTGFILVPFNTNVGTYEDFCVMKYEAKAQKDSDGVVDADGCEPDGCEIAWVTETHTPVSVTSGMPWRKVNTINAQIECDSMSEVGFEAGKFTLISNPEWMTIARNIESTDSNWSGGTVGDGHISRGWSAHASYGDTFTNTSTAPSTGTSCIYNTGVDSCGSTGDHKFKRTHTLSNNEEIWDLAGNVGEWVDWEATDDIFTYGPTTCSTTWYELTELNCAALFSNDYQSSGGYSYAENFGLWGGGLGAAARGGYFYFGYYSGIFSLDLRPDSSVASSAFGFRCVYRP